MVDWAPSRLRSALVAVLMGMLVVLPAGQAAGYPPRTCLGKRPTIVGGPGNNVIRGTNRADVLVGGGGKDTIYGRGGNDLICGNAGSDKIYGGKGADKISGGWGSDHLTGRPGSDHVWGKRGEDTLAVKDGVRGNDTATGGRGTDACTADNGDTVSSCKLPASPPPSQPVSNCAPSGGASLCITAPNATLTGVKTIGATVTGGSANPEIAFSWQPDAATAPTYLLTDYQSPFGFSWPTGKYLDGSGTLSAAVNGGSPVGVHVTLANGNSSGIINNPSDWKSLFQPRPYTAGAAIAAVGDGASGETNSNSVVSSVIAHNPPLFLYLGDVYDLGTYSEMRTYYGKAAFTPGAMGSSWGQMASYTLPVFGNHEGGHDADWEDYWHHVPFYTSLDYAGVHWILLDSECQAGVGCNPGDPQYNWLQTDLNQNSRACVVAMWHRPSVPSNSSMNKIWALLANTGGDLVLSGHLHDMEESYPLTAAKQPGSGAHMVQLISGAGGHLLRQNQSGAPIVWQKQGTPGALYLTPSGSGGPATQISWTFQDTSGHSLRTGSVNC